MTPSPRSLRSWPTSATSISTTAATLLAYSVGRAAQRNQCRSRSRRSTHLLEQTLERLVRDLSADLALLAHPDE